MNDPVTPAPHQDQRDAWAKAVAAHHRAQRANRARRKAQDPKPGSIRLRGSQCRDDGTARDEGTT